MRVVSTVVAAMVVLLVVLAGLVLLLGRDVERDHHGTALLGLVGLAVGAYVARLAMRSRAVAARRTAASCALATVVGATAAGFSSALRITFLSVLVGFLAVFFAWFVARAPRALRMQRTDT